ncbi:MAG: hypothetical protein ACI8UO_006535 [Verrucomicrobiales bacterium]|jgi:hypothetical protein
MVGFHPIAIPRKVLDHGCMKKFCVENKKRLIAAAILFVLLCLFILPNWSVLGTTLEWNILFFGVNFSIGTAVVIILALLVSLATVGLSGFMTNVGRLKKVQQSTTNELERARKAAVDAVSTATETQGELDARNKMVEEAREVIVPPAPRSESLVSLLPASKPD